MLYPRTGKITPCRDFPAFCSVFPTAAGIKVGCLALRGTEPRKKVLGRGYLDAVMDVVVQNEKTKLFLAERGGWTAKRKGAIVFANSIKALQFCLQNKIRGIVLLFSYHNPALDFTIAPFSDQESLEDNMFSAISDAVFHQVRNLELTSENQQLRSELDSLIAEGKERRKKRAFLSPFEHVTELTSAAEKDTRKFGDALGETIARLASGKLR